MRQQHWARKKIMQRMDAPNVSWRIYVIDYTEALNKSNLIYVETEGNNSKFETIETGTGQMGWNRAKPGTEQIFA